MAPLKIKINPGFSMSIIKNLQIHFFIQGSQKMHIRGPIYMADIEIQFLDCFQMMANLSTNIAVAPDSLEKFVRNIAIRDELCMWSIT